MKLHMQWGVFFSKQKLVWLC